MSTPAYLSKDPGSRGDFRDKEPTYKNQRMVLWTAVASRCLISQYVKRDTENPDHYNKF